MPYRKLVICKSGKKITKTVYVDTFYRPNTAKHIWDKVLEMIPTQQSIREIWDMVVDKTREFHTGYHVEAGETKIPLEPYDQLTGEEKKLIRLTFDAGHPDNKVLFWIVAK